MTNIKIIDEQKLQLAAGKYFRNKITRRLSHFWLLLFLLGVGVHYLGDFFLKTGLAPNTSHIIFAIFVLVLLLSIFLDHCYSEVALSKKGSSQKRQRAYFKFLLSATAADLEKIITKKLNRTCFFPENHGYNYRALLIEADAFPDFFKVMKKIDHQLFLLAAHYYRLYLEPSKKEELESNAFFKEKKPQEDFFFNAVLKIFSQAMVDHKTSEQVCEEIKSAFDAIINTYVLTGEEIIEAIKERC